MIASCSSAQSVGAWMTHQDKVDEMVLALLWLTERYAKLGRQHIVRTGNTAREIWKLLEKEEGVQAHTG